MYLYRKYIERVMVWRKETLMIKQMVLQVK